MNILSKIDNLILFLNNIDLEQKKQPVEKSEKLKWIPKVERWRCGDCGQLLEKEQFSKRQQRRFTRSQREPPIIQPRCFICTQNAENSIKRIGAHTVRTENMYLSDPSVLPIDGLFYKPNFLTLEEQRKLLQIIDSNPWQKFIKRRQQFYGKTYYHTTHDLASAQPEKGLEDDCSLPLSDLKFLLDKFSEPPYDCIFEDEVIDQCLVNEYIGNTGISIHYDDSSAFGKTIASVSLVQPVAFVIDLPMERTNVCEDVLKETEILLEEGALLVMKHDARYAWRHGIRKTKSIRMPGTGEAVFRDENYRRVSVTIRKLLDTRKRVDEKVKPEPWVGPSSKKNIKVASTA